MTVRAITTRGAGALALAACFGLGPGQPALGGTYVFAGEANGAELITHPIGYAGEGGPVWIGVCVDPESPHVDAMQTPISNVVEVMNGMTPTLGNLESGQDNDVPVNNIDFESVALHEIGHCMGLGHANLGSESGLDGSERDFTASTRGADAFYALDPGFDGITGSADDGRGDDENLHWFKRADNDPFSIATPVDASTYARSVAALPPGDAFAANGARTLAGSLGLPATEAVMQQGTPPDEAQRSLAHDDVATLRYARAGLDELSGTADDYTVTLEQVEAGPGCDIMIGFDDARTDFAECLLTGAFVPGPFEHHTRVTSARIYFNDDYLWHFNQASAAPPPVPAAGIVTRLLVIGCLVLIGAGSVGPRQS